MTQVRKKSKLVVRGFPSGVTETDVRAAFAPFIPAINYLEFRPAKIRPLLDACRTGTCWVNFAKPEDAAGGGGGGGYKGGKAVSKPDGAKEAGPAAVGANADWESRLHDFVEYVTDSVRFRDDKDREVPVTVEWAPYQRIPRKRRVRDARINTIEQDADYQAFLASLNASPAAPISAEKQLQEREKEGAISSGAAVTKEYIPISMLPVKSSPIVDFLKAQEMRERDRKLREKEKERAAKRERKWGASSLPAAAGGKGAAKSKAVLRSEEKKKLVEKKKAKEKLKKEIAKAAASGAPLSAEATRALKAKDKRKLKKEERRLAALERAKAAGEAMRAAKAAAAAGVGATSEGEPAPGSIQQKQADILAQSRAAVEQRQQRIQQQQQQPISSSSATAVALPATAAGGASAPSPAAAGSAAVLSAALSALTKSGLAAGGKREKGSRKERDRPQSGHPASGAPQHDQQQDYQDATPHPADRAASARPPQRHHKQRAQYEPAGVEGAEDGALDSSSARPGGGRGGRGGAGGRRGRGGKQAGRDGGGHGDGEDAPPPADQSQGSDGRGNAVYRIRKKAPSEAAPPATMI